MHKLRYYVHKHLLLIIKTCIRAYCPQASFFIIQRCTSANAHWRLVDTEEQKSESFSGVKVLVDWAIFICIFKYLITSLFYA